MISRKAQDEAIKGITDYILLASSLCRQPSIPNLLLTHGKPFYMNAGSFCLPREIPKQCYMNAYQVVSRSPGLTYVEGYCEVGIPIEHAWCVDWQGRVIDPTLPTTGSLHPRGYFGIPFEWDYVQATALRTGIYGVITIENARNLLKTPPTIFLS